VKIAPCPFCGRQPRVSDSEHSPGGTRGGWKKVECWTQPKPRGHGVDVHGPNRAAAVASWNRAFGKRGCK
jgi:hypothetical protein